MNYKSDSQKNKLENLERVSNSLDNDTDKQESVSKQINDRVQKTQPKNQNIALTAQWDTEWATMIPFVTGDYSYGSYQTWRIPIGNINLNWLPKFSIDLIYKNGESGEGDSSGYEVGPSLYFKKFIGWEIKDLISNPTSDVKTITLIVSIYDKLLQSADIYIKVLVKYVDKTNRD